MTTTDNLPFGRFFVTDADQRQIGLPVHRDCIAVSEGGAHDWGVNRGNSIIAGVVLIGILGSLSIALQATTPSTKSVAQVSVPVSSQVAAAVADADKSAIVCSPGFEYLVRMQGGKPLTTCYPTVYSNCTPPKTKDGKKTCTVVGDKGRNLPLAKAGECESIGYGAVYHCEPEGFGNSCSKEKVPGKDYIYSPEIKSCCKQTSNTCKSGEALTVKEASKYAGESLAGLGAEAAKEGNGDVSKAVKDAISANKTDGSFASGFNNAFKPEVEQQERDVNIAKTSYEQCTARKDCVDEAKLYSDEKKKLDEMYATQKRLAAAATSLEVPCPPDKENCRETGTRSPGPGNDTGGGRGTGSGNQGNTFGKGAMDSLGRLLGNQQNQNSAANRAAQQSAQQQQCQSRHFCVNNTLYWGSQNSYSYNQTQEYENGNGGYNYSYVPMTGSCPTQVVQQCQNGCASGGTQCNGGGQGGGSTATLSCGGGALFDVGASVPISFSCANAVSSTGSGFSTEGAISGTASTTIQKPPPGADIVSYGLTCTASNNQTSSARCDVKINATSMMLVANPKQVASNATSTIGWVTKGMKTCVISSPNAAASSTLEKFNEDNADIENVSGIAVTPPLTTDTEFTLSCVTKSDKPKTSTIKVKVGS